MCTSCGERKKKKSDQICTCILTRVNSNAIICDDSRGWGLNLELFCCKFQHSSEGSLFWHTQPESKKQDNHNKRYMYYNMCNSFIQYWIKKSRYWNQLVRRNTDLLQYKLKKIQKDYIQILFTELCWLQILILNTASTCCLFLFFLILCIVLRTNFNLLFK